MFKEIQFSDNLKPCHNLLPHPPEEGEGEDYDTRLSMIMTVDYFERTIDGEFRLKISKVMHDGWEMGDFCGDSNTFLRLLPEIANLGMEGVSISCMCLGLHKGV